MNKQTNNIQLVLLPGLDGTGIFFRPFLKNLPLNIQPIVITYPMDLTFGYEKLFQFVLDLLPKEKHFILLGESFGGPLALKIAATQPKNLKAIILCASFVSCPHFIPAWISPLIQDFLFCLPSKKMQAKLLFTHYLTDEFESLSNEALQLISPQIIVYRIREIIKINVKKELSKCDYPILYIQGKDDFIVPQYNFKRIANLKPNIKLIQLFSSHMVLQIQPKEAIKAIQDFIFYLSS